MFGKIGFSILFAQVPFAALLSIESYWWIPALVLGVLLGFGVVIILIRRKPKTPLLSNEGVDRLAALFGGFANIVKAELDGQRLKVLVKSVAVANLEGLRAMGGQGLFVTGNQIKMTMASTPQAFVDAVKQESEGSPS